MNLITRQRWWIGVALALFAASSTARAQLPGGYVASGPGGLIPDHAGAVWPTTPPAQFAESTIVLPANVLTIEEVRILGLFHPRIGDLHAVLISPAGQAYTLFHRPGFDGSSLYGFLCDFVGDYGVSVEPSSTWPSTDPGEFEVLPSGSYPQSAGNWPSGALQISNQSLRVIAAEPGAWKLRIYDWSFPFIGSFTGCEIRGARQHGFNVDFDGFVTPPPPSYAGAAAQGGTWNMSWAFPLQSAILPADGIGPEAQMTHAPSFGVAFYTYPSGEHAGLMRDVLQASAPLEFSVDGLRNGRWGVWVYAWDPADWAYCKVTIHGGTRGAQQLGGVWNGFLEEGVTHAYDEVLVTAHGLSVSITSEISDPVANGFQLVYLGHATKDWTPYCQMGISQDGCFPTLIGSGTFRASATSGFELQCYDVDGQRNGMFLYGLDAAFVPFGATYLCMSAPRQRAGGVQGSGGTAGVCDGFLSLDLRAWLASHPNALGNPFAVGDALYAQTWYRDPGHGALDSNTSDAVAVYVLP